MARDGLFGTNRKMGSQEGVLDFPFLTPYLACYISATKVKTILRFDL